MYNKGRCVECPGRRLCHGNNTDDVLAKSFCILSFHKVCQGKEMNICLQNYLQVCLAHGWCQRKWTYVFTHGVCRAPCQVCAKGMKLMYVCTRCLELFLALGWCQGNERDDVDIVYIYVYGSRIVRIGMGFM